MINLFSTPLSFSKWVNANKVDTMSVIYCEPTGYAVNARTFERLFELTPEEWHSLELFSKRKPNGKGSGCVNLHNGTFFFVDRKNEFGNLLVQKVLMGFFAIAIGVAFLVFFYNFLTL